MHELYGFGDAGTTTILESQMNFGSIRFHQVLASVALIAASIIGVTAITPGSVAAARAFNAECETDACLEEVTIYGSLFEVGGAIFDIGFGDSRFTMDAIAQEISTSNEAERSEPACLEEQVIKQDVQNMISSPAVQGNLSDPPGKLIIPNSLLGDPAYRSDPAWNKWSVTARWTRTSDATVYLVEIHYMFNDRTRQSSQFKFKNSPYRGCGRA
jgi:hypothetical protein